MIVEKIIPKNIIINLGCASVDNHIPGDDIFDYHILKNVIFIVMYTHVLLFVMSRHTKGWCMMG